MIELHNVSDNSSVYLPIKGLAIFTVAGVTIIRVGGSEYRVKETPTAVLKLRNYALGYNGKAAEYFALDHAGRPRAMNV